MNYGAASQLEVTKVGKSFKSEKRADMNSSHQSSFLRVWFPRLFSGKSSTELTPTEPKLPSAGVRFSTAERLA
jgi:hypothetical protein